MIIADLGDQYKFRSASGTESYIAFGPPIACLFSVLEPLKSGFDLNDSARISD